MTSSTLFSAPYSLILSCSPPPSFFSLISMFNKPISPTRDINSSSKGNTSKIKEERKKKWVFLGVSEWGSIGSAPHEASLALQWFIFQSYAETPDKRTYSFCFFFLSFLCVFFSFYSLFVFAFLIFLCLFFSFFFLSFITFLLISLFLFFYSLYCVIVLRWLKIPGLFTKRVGWILCYVCRELLLIGEY